MKSRGSTYKELNKNVLDDLGESIESSPCSQPSRDSQHSWKLHDDLPGELSTPSILSPEFCRPISVELKFQKRTQGRYVEIPC